MDPQLVHFEGEAVIRLPADAHQPAQIELVAGRDRYSVGGAITEGPRWWHGHIEWADGALLDLHLTGSEIAVELSNGRLAIAIVEHTSASPRPTSTIRGLGPPPFEVP